MRAFVKHHAGWLQLAIVIVVVGGSLFLSASLGPDPAPVRSAKPETRLTVTVVTPVVSSYRPYLTLTGTVEASTVTNIVPQVSGKVIHVSPSFRPGARISKGELLFAIESSDYELAMQRTLADIEIARSDLFRLQAEATAEKKIWSSSKPQNDIPDLIARVPQIAAANARIRAGEAARAAAELSLERTKIYAPFDARVIESRLDVGQVVSGTLALGSIYSIENLEVVAPVSSDDLRRIGKPIGRSVTIVSDYTTDEEIAGSVVRLGATLDEFTRLGKLYIRSEANDRLTLGEFVSVVVAGDTVDTALGIPESSLTARDQVWVVDGDTLAERRVQILGHEQGLIVVAAFDMAGGVVTIPPAGARDGQIVKVQKIEPLTSLEDADVGE
ncbi:MAG: efflux RND transporter periplasmic adaptor subunit [Gammaproteobacteria bacterium]|nr:efflux RND transporter periplasmic adaptor subunit [Gammaproteobacteria bacterium]